MTQPIDGGTPDDDPLIAVGGRIADRLDTIDTGIGNLVLSNRRSRRWIYALSFVATAAVVAVFAVGFVVVQIQAANAKIQETNAELKATNRCLVVVVAANADRIGALTPANTKRVAADRAVNKARDDLLELAIKQADRARLKTASDVFVRAKVADDQANDEYDAAAADNPPPPNPREAC